MWVVLASRLDHEAQHLVHRLGAERFGLMTPDDLSLVGWRFDPLRVNRGWAVVAGQTLQTEDIEGVLNFLPTVQPFELTHIMEDDRIYVAAEMHAFLMAWLTALSCPVVNRPLPPYLVGPGWSRSRWQFQAHSLGLETEADPAASRQLSWVSIVGSQVLGTTDRKVTQAALQLARAASLRMGCFGFVGRRFHAATPRPDLRQVGVPEALALLTAGTP